MKQKIGYAAFLRGINVGGHAPVRMAALKKAFEEMGFEKVRTLLASGNVLFESAHADRKVISGRIASGMGHLLKKEVGVAVRSLRDLEEMRAADPFKGIDAGPSVRFYVTFLGAAVKPCGMELPAAAPAGDFRILRVTATEVFSVLDLARGMGTPEAMGVIEKEFGTGVTTRNWNTVLKALQ